MDAGGGGGAGGFRPRRISPDDAGPTVLRRIWICYCVVGFGCTGFQQQIEEDFEDVEIEQQIFPQIPL
jgi:hypothetical protein